MRRWVLLIVGLALGLAGGLIYTWQINPPDYYDTYPPLLHEFYREDWIRMTALAYSYNGNWSRVKLRLTHLSESEIRRVMERTLNEVVEEGRPIGVVRRLARMAAYYGVDNPTVRTYAEGMDNTLFVTPLPSPVAVSQQPATPPPSPTPTPLSFPTPTPTLPPFDISPTPVLVPAPYQVMTETQICTENPFISVSVVISQTVRVRGRNRSELVGVPVQELWLLWDDGADRAVTGLRPAEGLGYADFAVAPDYAYKLYVGAAVGAPVALLSMAPCVTEEGEEGWASYDLIVEMEE